MEEDTENADQAAEDVNPAKVLAKVVDQAVEAADQAVEDANPAEALAEDADQAVEDAKALAEDAEVPVEDAEDSDLSDLVLQDRYSSLRDPMEEMTRAGVKMELAFLRDALIKYAQL